MDVRYFYDDDTGNVIRLKDTNIEIYRVSNNAWEILPRDCSYMREIFIGQGNNCLTEITQEIATKIINEQKKKSDKNYIALGLGLGVSFGIAFGSIFDNVGAGLAIGIGVGMSIGAGIKKKGIKNTVI